MAARKRTSKSSSRTRTAAGTAAKTAKALEISPVLMFLLILVGIIFVYSTYLELDTDEIPESVVSSFISKDADLEIHFINVGQGDCSLIMWNGRAMLIDSGEKEAAETVLNYLKKQGVSKLDYVVATHPHADHMGSMSEVISRVEVEKVIAPKVSNEMTPTSKVYENFLKALKDKALKLTAAKPGTVYTFETDREEEKKPPEFEILAPLEDYDDLNNYSVVLKLTYGSTSYLFTGDAEKKAERAILKSGADVDSDVMKVGHHGSSTSTGESFLEAVSPEICIIQCGEGNKYGHPHRETLDMIEGYGAKLYSNEKNGTIVVYSDGERIYVQTEIQE